MVFLHKNKIRLLIKFFWRRKRKSIGCTYVVVTSGNRQKGYLHLTTVNEIANVRILHLNFSDFKLLPPASEGWGRYCFQFVCQFTPRGRGYPGQVWMEGGWGRGYPSQVWTGGRSGWWGGGVTPARSGWWVGVPPSRSGWWVGVPPSRSGWWVGVPPSRSGWWEVPPGQVWMMYLPPPRHDGVPPPP